MLQEVFSNFDSSLPKQGYMQISAKLSTRDLDHGSCCEAVSLVTATMSAADSSCQLRDSSLRDSSFHYFEVDHLLHTIWIKLERSFFSPRCRCDASLYLVLVYGHGLRAVDVDTRCDNPHLAAS